MNIQIFNDEELVASEKDKTLISSKAKNIWVTKKTLWQFSSREAANIKHKRMTLGNCMNVSWKLNLVELSARVSKKLSLK